MIENNNNEEEEEEEGPDQNQEPNLNPLSMAVIPYHPNSIFTFLTNILTRDPFSLLNHICSLENNMSHLLAENEALKTENEELKQNNGKAWKSPSYSQISTSSFVQIYNNNLTVDVAEVSESETRDGLENEYTSTSNFNSIISPRPASNSNSVTSNVFELRGAPSIKATATTGTDTETEREIEAQKTCVSFVSVLAPPHQITSKTSRKLNDVQESISGTSSTSISPVPSPTIQSIRPSAVLPPQALPEPCNNSLADQSMVHLIALPAQVETENIHVSSEDISVAINRNANSHLAEDTETPASSITSYNNIINVNATASMPDISYALAPNNLNDGPQATPLAALVAAAETLLNPHVVESEYQTNSPPSLVQIETTLLSVYSTGNHDNAGGLDNDSNDSLHVNVNAGDLNENDAEDLLNEIIVDGGDDVLLEVESSSSSSTDSADGRGDVGTGLSTPSSPHNQSQSASETQIGSVTSIFSFHPSESLNLGGKYGNLTLQLRPRPPSGHRYVISVNEMKNRRKNGSRLPSWVPTYAQRLECILHQFMDEIGNIGVSILGEDEVVEVGPQMDLVFVRLRGNPPARLLQFDDSSDSEDSCIRSIHAGTKHKKSCLKISREGSVGESRPKSLSWSQHVYVANIPSQSQQPDGNGNNTKTRSCPGIYYMGEFSIATGEPPNLGSSKVRKHNRRKRFFHLFTKIFRCFRCDSPPPPYVQSTTDLLAPHSNSKQKVVSATSSTQASVHGPSPGSSTQASSASSVQTRIPTKFE